MTEQIDAVRDHVRQRYAAAATAVTTGIVASCCSIDTSGTVYDIKIGEGSVVSFMARPSVTSCRLTPSRRAWAAATPWPSQTYTKATRCSTRAPAAESMCSSPPGVSDPPARSTGWT